MSLQSADRPAGCVVFFTPSRADLVQRALCLYVVSSTCKPSERAELADIIELLGLAESFERGAP